MVELAPAVIPAVGDGGDRGVGVCREHPLGSPAVRGELDGPLALGLLEPLRRQLDEAGAELFGLARLRGDGCPNQWKMFRSFSKKPW
jgi:hypothetical protein